MKKEKIPTILKVFVILNIILYGWSLVGIYIASNSNYIAGNFLILSLIESVAGFVIYLSLHLRKSWSYYLALALLVYKIIETIYFFLRYSQSVPLFGVFVVLMNLVFSITTLLLLFRNKKYYLR